MFRQAHIPLRVSTSELMSWGQPPFSASKRWEIYGKINRLSKATLTCAQCLVSPLQARAWSGNGHGSKFQKPQQGTQLPKQTAWLKPGCCLFIPQTEGMDRKNLRNLPNQQDQQAVSLGFSSLNTSAVAASQVLIGSRGRF